MCEGIQTMKCNRVEVHWLINSVNSTFLCKVMFRRLTFLLLEKGTLSGACWEEEFTRYVDV